MAQHFLLSAAARTLSLVKVMRMSDDQAFEAFKAIRWSDNGGEPYCHKCGCAEVYTYNARKLWKCKGCDTQFSITSGTIFASRKLPLRDLLAAIAIFTNGAKGYSALQLSRDLDVQYKTAFVMAHKLREAMAGSADRSPLTGDVEVDGAYFGGYVKPANEKENRRDRRLSENQSGKRQVVVIMRERKGRAMPFVTATEAAGVPLVRENVDSSATIHADEAAHWDVLEARYAAKRINHSEAYSLAEGCTNQAESFFSRLRRCEVGTHHHVAGKYLQSYADEMAWRENFRRVSNGEQFMMIVGAAITHPMSRQWKGYWQRAA
ncbi:IS1595 family transposase [Asticcacaulis sp. AND118]|uniref:IS1595 family transposase n=1 Tax=Asticcacaulis sp. AND118 TaxID=2840468 RepID=UPI001CFF8570|nr:IS1595 family transposase [Asticcacaulis sp. AND118]UDF03495.1 IS1595 family transposase [Asticcacaulis sp. AND118]